MFGRRKQKDIDSICIKLDIDFNGDKPISDDVYEISSISISGLKKENLL